MYCRVHILTHTHSHAHSYNNTRCEFTYIYTHVSHIYIYIYTYTTTYVCITGAFCAIDVYTTHMPTHHVCIDMTDHDHAYITHISHTSHIDILDDRRWLYTAYVF